MPDNTANDIFRFVQIRPPLPPDEQPFARLITSALSQNLVAARTVDARVGVANAFLASSEAIQSLGGAYRGSEIRDAIESLRADPKATTTELLKKVKIPVDETFNAARQRLSDTLLATLFAMRGYPTDLAELQDVFRVYDLVERTARGKGKVIPLAVFLQRPIVTPFPLEPLPPPVTVLEAARRSRTDVVASTGSITAAIAELAALDRSRFINAPGEGVSFALKAAHRPRLSEEAQEVLAARALDPTTMPLFAVIDELEQEWRSSAPRREAVPAAPRGEEKLPIPGPIKPFVRPSGVADLLVVKQHLKRYEPIDIAHIENVLTGEKKSRSHRRLERSEETFTRETETTTEKEKELETADRFELNRESSKTIRDSLDIGVDLSVSGKYGPTVEFSSKFELDSKHASEETAKNAATFAHTVVERSLERITERVREEIVRKLILETEETNLHELNNGGGGGKHVRGVYQFLEKVYEAQVFNYGIREMFDFMVPEPASFVWWMQGRPSTVKLPEPPPPLDLADATAVTVDNFRIYAARYGVLDLELPPPEYRRVLVGKKHGDDNASEKDQPRSVDRVEVTLPSGYVPSKAIVRVSCYTDENPVLSVTILDQNKVWKPVGKEDLSDGHRLHTFPPVEFDFSSIVTPQLLTGDKLGIETMMWESNSYALEILMVCARTGEEYLRWKFATYKKIREAYEDRVREHEQKVRALKAEAESLEARNAGRSFGRAPSENHRTVMTELKKHCLSILTQQWFDTFDATNDGTDSTPPTFDLAEADQEGAFIRFFEQAFEWEQIQWVFYPYFWARINTWPERFSRQDVDPLFREFLQAGSARVVVPVRPGFEEAITHFIETGKIWNGAGAPPVINSPLYVSIIDEIRDRTGAGKGEFPVGEPWDIRLPTPLVYLRAKDDLPQWKRVPGKDWEWQAVEAP